MTDKYGYIGIETLLNFCENTKDHAVTPNDFMRLPRIASGAVNKEAVIALLEQLAAEEKAMWDRTDDAQAFGAYTALEGAVENVEAMKIDQPERKTDEWCVDCKEYDHERHCCPRFNRVIRETVDEVKDNQWMPCSERLPESDGVYLVYAPDYRGGSSSAKEWHNGIMFAKFKHGKWSVEVGYYNRPGCVRAWMPMPDPWKGDKE